MPEFRTYRKIMQGDRFVSFVVTLFETDCWIGINKKSYHKDMVKFAKERIKFYRSILDKYISRNPLFLKTFSPLDLDKNSHEIIQAMLQASVLSNTGPMSTVAGAFSEFIGKDIEKEFDISEIVIENGGDIYLDIKSGFNSVIYAGDSPLSNKIGLKIPESFSPLGICTSSATVGHSKSFGKADAVTVVSKNTLIADAFATAYCNMVKSENDIQKVLSFAKENKDIISCAIIFNDKFGIIGDLKPVFYK